MSDDALDAAQIAINTAAQQSGSTPVPVTNDVPPAPPAPQPVSQNVPPEPIPEPLPATPATVHDEPLITKSSKEAMVNELLSSTTIVPSPVVSSSETPPQKSHGSLPKKKSGKGLLLAVLVTFLLTLPVAVYYISQQDEQLADVRSRATCTVYCGDGGSCSNTRPCANGYECENGTCHGNPVTSTCGRDSDPGAPVCCDPDASCDNPVCEGQNRLECNTGGVHCTIEADGCTEGTPDNPSDNQPEPTPTPPPTPICLNIKIYKDGVQVTPSTLKPNDLIQITVMGTGAPTKARFRVNGAQIVGDTDTDPNWTISTTKKTGTEEYSIDYTMPTGVTQFLFEAETFAEGAWH